MYAGATVRLCHLCPMNDQIQRCWWRIISGVTAHSKRRLLTMPSGAMTGKGTTSGVVKGERIPSIHLQKLLSAEEAPLRLAPG